MSTRSGGAASFDSLPDDLALAVLAALPVQDRCGPAALVCRRFHTLATHPSLLRNLHLHVYEIGGSGAAADERLAAKLNALCTFLVRHAAAHLRRLVLCVQLCPTTETCDASCAALKTLCFRLAAHCSAWGALEELSVDGSNLVGPFSAGCFTPLAPTLQRLRHEMHDELAIFGDGCVTPNLAKMTRLQELRVLGDTQRLGDGTVFSPALTNLQLGCYHGWGLPPSLSSLKQLQSFHLGHCPINDDDLEPLVHCPALTQLVLESCFNVPTSLAQLTQLQVLRVSNTPEHPEEQHAGRPLLLSALRQLVGLTHLALSNMGCLDGVPAEVGGLPQLARFCWQPAAAEDQPDLQLPSGPWLTSLHQLAVPLTVAAASLPRLTAAQQLECLALQPHRRLPWQGERSNKEQRQRQLHQAVVLAWAVQHPRLARLAMDDEDPADMFDWRAALALARWPGRPPLAIVPSQPVFDELGCSCSILSPW